jgi:hypothetical protein
MTLRNFSENTAKSKTSYWSKPLKTSLKTKCLKNNNRSLM